MPTVPLASEVMDRAAALLNDTSRSLYTNAVQLPYLQKANEYLEQVLLTYGIVVQRKKSTAISVTALSQTLTLPSDFLLPIKLSERAVGETDADWIPMIEDNWTHFVQSTTLTVWTFENNAINLAGATVAREVLLEYERSLATITVANSPIDTYLFKNFLASKTAEYCARYIGMNSTLADEIKTVESDKDEDNLERIFVLNQQGTRRRRIRQNNINTQNGVILR